ncbi:Alpha/Beta hydrolase protein [Xylariales sp. PMI_506]|nr:Alpha/Beta hydrolase protein [Xylariales sp. PMI_506]
MRFSSTFSALLLSIATAKAKGVENGSAASFGTYYPPTADCYEYQIPVTVASSNMVFNISEWQDDYALQGFLAGITTRPFAGFAGFVSGEKEETESFTIAASFCSPKASTGSKAVILATHGIGQARSHWNSQREPESYNFVQHAISKGYSVFFYDRLGYGDSQKVSGYTNQSRKQRQVLRQLATLIRSGDYTGNLGKPDKLIAMGFSFGSYVTHYTIAAYPELFDGAVLTGINYNLTAVNGNGLFRSFVPRIAALQDPQRFGTLDSGYLTWVDVLAQVNTYFKYPFYDIATAAYAEENKNAFGIGEFATIIDGDLDAGNFTGAALAITSETDYIVCDGFCPGIFEEPARTIFRNAKTFVPYLHPDASHNFNFEFNATGAYNVITDFLDKNI